MTLEELIDRYRPSLADESVAVRRSWEEMFTQSLRHYSRDTAVESFDPDVLSERLRVAGMHPVMVEGYVRRWRAMLSWAGDS